MTAVASFATERVDQWVVERAAPPLQVGCHLMPAREGSHWGWHVLLCESLIVDAHADGKGARADKEQERAPRRGASGSGLATNGSIP